MDGDGSLAASADSLNHRSWATHRIPAGEDARYVGSRRKGIDIKCPSPCDVHGVVLGKAGQVNSLTDGGDEHVDIKDEFRPLDRYGAPSTAGIRFAQFHPNTLQAHHLSPVAQYPDWRRQIVDFDIFSLGVLYFLLISRHLLS